MMFRFTVPLHSLACGIILVSKLYYVHYHPCPNPRKHAILTREKKNFVIPTVVMAHQKRFQVFLTSGERRPLVKAFLVHLACSYASCQRRLIAATASQSDRTKGNAARSRRKPFRSAERS